MKSYPKICISRTALKGGLLGMITSVIFMAFLLLMLSINKEAVTQGSIGAIIAKLTYVPINSFEYFVNIGLVSKHNILLAICFIWVWLCLIFFVLGYMTGLLFQNIKQNKEDETRPENLSDQQ